MTNNKINIRNIPVILTVLLAALWFTGCTRSLDEPPIPPGNNSKEVTITVSIPDTGIPTTRSMAGGGEDQVQTIDLLIFDATDSNHEILKQRIAVESGNIGMSSADGTSYVTFPAKLDLTDYRARIVIVANSQIGSIVSTLIGSEKKDVMAALAYSTPGNLPSDWKWKADDSSPSGYTAIPMYGEKLLDGRIHPLMGLINGIELTRMLARIDVLNNTPGSTDFTVDNVYLVNYNTAGYIAPAWNPANGQLLGDVPATPLIPSDPGKKPGEANAIPYTVNGAATSKYEGEIYTYESPAAAEWGSGQSDPTARQQATCLIIEGHIGTGEPSFYRVDFTLNDGSGFMPLFRNYKYIIDIREVSGVGFANIGDALQSYSVVSNLKTRLIYYNRSKIKNIVFSGQHMLGAGESDINLSRYSTTVEIDMFTDSPGGWEAAITAGSDWLTIAGSATGAANAEDKLYVDIPYLPDNEGPSRTGTISVTAGRLSLSINLTQTITSEGVGTIKVMDEDGNPIDQMFFLLNRVSQEAIEPQTIYVVWTGASTDCQVGLYVPGGSDPPLIEYETFTPLPGRGGGNEITLPDGGIQAFTIQPKPGSSQTVYWKADNLFFALYDGSGPVANKNIYIGQGDPEFNLNVDPNGYPLGASYQIPLGTNTKWTVMSITATGASVAQLLGSGGDIQVGNSGADPGDGYLTTPLTLNLAPWSYGVSGTLTVTFKLEYAGFVFSKVIEIEVKPYLNYVNGTNNAARYYVSPVRYTNISDGSPTTMNYSTAAGLCTAMGSGWRLPTSSELQMSYAYSNAFSINNGVLGWYEPFHWSSSTSGTDYVTVQFGMGYLGHRTGSLSTEVTARCVYPNQSPSGTAYPYIDTSYSSEGVLIVSRDGGSGVDEAALLGSGETPDGSNELNKVARKLLVANTNLSGGMTWTAATTACPSGWRLPTQREVYLIMSLGGTTMSVTAPGYPSGWPTTSRIDGSIWMLTENGSAAWIFQTVDGGGYPAMYDPAKTTNWGGVRCVKTVE